MRPVRIAFNQNDLLVWQLADSAFPAGGFAHSGGLEAAVQHGEISNRGGLLYFLENALHQIGRGALPFVSCAHKNPDNFPSIDQHYEVFTSNHVANRASKLQGRAFLSSSIRIFPQSRLNAFAQIISDQKLPSHFAPGFGAILSFLEIGHETACRSFLFIHLRGLISSAVRLGIVGPLEGQGIQFQMSDHLEIVLKESSEIHYKDAVQTAPLYEIWQSNQDRLYSRLFQS